jgi:NAD(P)H dehydrogenase (quinone)
MRVLVLYAHPVETSFGAAVHKTLVETLRRRGHEIDDCDLNAEKFDPVMSRQDRLDYHNVAVNQTRVKPYVDRLLNAEALAFSFPVWNMGFPAILKGFIDKVFLPGVSFYLKENGDYVPSLTNIRKLGVLHLRRNAASHVPGRRSVPALHHAIPTGHMRSGRDLRLCRAA